MGGLRIKKVRTTALNCHYTVHAVLSMNEYTLCSSTNNRAIAFYLEDILVFFGDTMSQQVCLINYQKSILKLFRKIRFFNQSDKVFCRNEYRNKLQNKTK